MNSPILVHPTSNPVELRRFLRCVCSPPTHSPAGRAPLDLMYSARLRSVPSGWKAEGATASVVVVYSNLDVDVDADGGMELSEAMASTATTQTMKKMPKGEVALPLSILITYSFRYVSTAYCFTSVLPQRAVKDLSSLSLTSYRRFCLQCLHINCCCSTNWSYILAFLCSSSTQERCLSRDYCAAMRFLIRCSHRGSLLLISLVFWSSRAKKWNLQ